MISFVLRILTGFHRCSIDVIMFSWYVQMFKNWAVQGATGRCWAVRAVLGGTRLCWLYWAVVGGTGLYWAVLGCCGWCWAVVDCAGRSWAVLDGTRL